MRRPGWAELWWVDFGPPVGPRPAVVLTRPEAVQRLDRILIAPASTKVRGLPTEVHLDAADGLPKACVLQLDTPELIDPTWCTDYICRLSAVRWDEICRALAGAINC